MTDIYCVIDDNGYHAHITYQPIQGTKPGPCATGQSDDCLMEYSPEEDTDARPFGYGNPLTRRIGQGVWAAGHWLRLW